MLPTQALRIATGALALFAGSFAFLPSARADTYTVYDVANSSGSVNNIGLTTSGTLVVFKHSNNTYVTFTPPSSSVVSTTAPSLTYDNGSACSVGAMSAYTSVGAGVCNNGHEVFLATVGNGRDELFDGPDPLADLVYDSNAGSLLLNSVGDLAFVSLNNPNPRLEDSNLLLIHAATPEPSSLMLLGTGLVGAVGTMRRRLRLG